MTTIHVGHGDAECSAETSTKVDLWSRMSDGSETMTLLNTWHPCMNLNYNRDAGRHTTRSMTLSPEHTRSELIREVQKLSDDLFAPDSLVGNTKRQLVNLGSELSRQTPDR